jgi:predicted transcriptional regulator
LTSELFATTGLPTEEYQEGRRSPIDMACDILRVLSEGQAKPTHILQKANMNWNVLSSNLDYLYGHGLVDRIGRRGTRTEYRLTLKGRSILELYEALKLSLKGVASVRPASGSQALNDNRRHRGFGKGLEWRVGKIWKFSTSLS